MHNRGIDRFEHGCAGINITPHRPPANAEALHADNKFWCGFAQKCAQSLQGFATGGHDADGHNPAVLT